MITSIRDLKDIHFGRMIFVVASGKSLDYLPTSVFANQLVVGVNQAYRDFPCDYVVMHHGDDGQDVINRGMTLVASEYDCGERLRGRNVYEGDYYTYAHIENPQTSGIDLGALDTDDRLAISASTTAEAVHFAAHLGASVIVLCGADCGRLDGEINYGGYNGGAGTDPTHIPITEPLLLRLVNAIRRRGVVVCSLNSFINPGMEGHIYSRPPVGTVYVGKNIQRENGQKTTALTPMADPVGATAQS